MVKPDQTVEQRTVVAEPAGEAGTIIEQGVAAGETVVVDGQLGLVAGARVAGPRAAGGQPVNIAETFIRRPVATTLVMAAILVFGMFAYAQLPVSDLPNVDFPTIQVTANLPGANPETMAAAVATPLERQFSTIAGLDSMTSVNALGISNITLQFNLARDIDAAAQDVQAAIAKAARQLPPDMPTPPSYQKVNPADQPVLYLALSSPTLPLSEVNEYAETLLAQRISTVSGVAQVSVFGSQKYAVRVQLDPARAGRARARHRRGRDRRPARQRQPAHRHASTAATRRSPSRPTASSRTPPPTRPLIVAYRNGAPVRLGDIGRVVDGVENDKIASWFSGTRGHRAGRAAPAGHEHGRGGGRGQGPPARPSASQMPASVNLEILIDRSQSIRESVADVKFTLLLTIALVVMVIFLFLRNLSATVIPSLALPMSIVGTFAVMDLLGYSLDNLSLMALTLSVGFVVDDAIVMLENIVRHLEQGKRPMEAALVGSREIGFTIVSMTISLVAVFLPVLFMGGLLGRLLHEFAVTIAVAILVSGFVSLTLTPMLCSRFLKPQHDQQPRPALRGFRARVRGRARPLRAHAAERAAPSRA